MLGAEGSSNTGNTQKKKKKTEQSQLVEKNVEKEFSKPVQENVKKEVSKEVIPSKTRILKGTKKSAQRPRHSPKRPSVSEVEAETPTKSHNFSKGALVSPASKKCQAQEMVKKLNKKQRLLEDPVYKVVAESEHCSDSEHSEIHIYDIGFGSPQRDSPIKKLEESVNLTVAELKPEMTKEVEKIEKNYSVLHGKVDVVADSITKLVEYNTSYSTKLNAKTEHDSKVFNKLEEFLSSIKDTLLQVSFTITSTTTTSKLITKMILIGESVGGSGSSSKPPP
ncbi:unnamed protein product [Lactuca virosa]|uniref:Uncharacterized protein n=1 Tax=Lactuca virosa TaxID=75947 RepID=A0AAU9M986_9ASTR|nr:unnamed protein product [Lactuca virosa]